MARFYHQVRTLRALFAHRALHMPTTTCTATVTLGVRNLFRSLANSRCVHLSLAHQGKFDSSNRTPPFELEALEAALTVAVGRLDAEMSAVTGRVSALLTKLPSDITPVNLEELRRVKQALVELENKSDTLRWGPRAGLAVAAAGCIGGAACAKPHLSGRPHAHVPPSKLPCICLSLLSRGKRALA